MVTAMMLLGFDVTHAVLTLTQYRPAKVIALLAAVNGSIDPRTSIAYSSLEQVAKAMRIDIAKVEVEVTRIAEAVQKVRNTIVELAKIPPVIIDVGGGMRILLLETILAYLSLHDSVRNYIKVVMYLEGTDKSFELTSNDIKNLISRPAVTLSAIERLILKTMVSGQEYKLSEIHVALQKQGINVTKQYVLKVVKKLVTKGIISQRARGYYIKIKDVEV